MKKKFLGEPTPIVLSSILPKDEPLREKSLNKLFLAFALVFNDIKGVFLFNDLLKHSYKAPTAEICAHTGEYNGATVHIRKLLVGIINEFFKIIQENREIIATPHFIQIQKKLPNAVKNEWIEIKKYALYPQGGDKDFLSKIAEVRSNIVYHYSDTMEIPKFFKELFYFSQKDENNLEAYASFGDNLEETRFYYCDALVDFYFKTKIGEEISDNFQRLRQVVENIEHIIYHFEKLHLKVKN